MKKLYTAVGRLNLRENARGNRCPVIVVHGEETIPNMPEMIVWTILQAEILSEAELEARYQKRKVELGFRDHRSIENVLYWLLQRGVIAEGAGETDEDALYDLLGRLYIVPIPERRWLELGAFLRLVVVSGMSVGEAKQVFNREKVSREAGKILRLTGRVKLSVAEIVRCVERDVFDLRDESEIVERLYQDDYTTEVNIVDEMRPSPVRPAVLRCVADLYRRRKIVLE